MKLTSDLEIKRLLRIPIRLDGLSMEEMIEKILLYLGIDRRSFVVQNDNKSKRINGSVKVVTPSTVFQLFIDSVEFESFIISVKPTVTVSVRELYVDDLKPKFKLLTIENRELPIQTLDFIYEAYRINNLILVEDAFKISTL